MLHCILAVLKYVPAALCLLLLVGWVVSLTYMVKFMAPVPLRSVNVGVAGVSTFKGHAILWWESRSIPRFKATAFRVHPADYANFPTGIRRYYYPDDNNCELQCPYVVLLTILAPLALGCLIRFRFPLWSYFVWLAVFAAELTYFPR